MKIRLTVDEAEQIACALCFCQIELEAHAHDPDGDPEERKQSAEAAPFYEQMCKRFRGAAEKSQGWKGGGVTIDIE